MVVEVERHEALMWTRCVEAGMAIAGNPLGALVDRSTGVPLTSMTAIDSDEFNRVVGLGIGVPATPSTVTAIFDFYQSLGQSQFRVEVAPFAGPGELFGWLEDGGLQRSPETVMKLWEPLTANSPAVDDPGGVEIRTLDSSDGEAVAKLNVLGYGAWDSEIPLEPWFAATVGYPGFIHYGAFVGDRLVAAAAIFVENDLAWFGLAVTHPRFRSRSFQQSLTAIRLKDARDLGSLIIHGEVRSSRVLSPRGRLFGNAYEKLTFRSGDPGRPPTV